MVNFKTNVFLENHNPFSFFPLVKINKEKMFINIEVYAHTKVLPVLDMNAGTVQCKCGVHYTARDHPLCRNCSARSCSRSHPCSFCLRLSSTEWDLWLDQEARTSDFGSKRFLEESSSPATEGLGSSQDDKLDSSESPGISRSGSSGEVLTLASHTGGEARITNLETGLSSLQASLNNISSLLTSRLGPSVGTKTPLTSLPLGTPPLGGVPVSGVVNSRSSSLLPVTPVSMGSPVLSVSQPVFSLPSFQPNDEDRFAGEQRVYPTEVEVRFENRQVEDCLLDDSMEQDGGSEEIVHSSTLSPPFGGGIETLGLFPHGSLVLVDTRH